MPSFVLAAGGDEFDTRVLLLFDKHQAFATAKIPSKFLSRPL
jgi:hypothetical protein